MPSLAASPSSGYNFVVPPVLPTLRVKILFFGRVRELVGLTEEIREIPEATTLHGLFQAYIDRFPRLADFRPSLVASRNQEFAAWNTPLANGDEVAFLPPVSGG
jgi:molybdopterin converting factor subunit 1